MGTVARLEKVPFVITDIDLNGNISVMPKGTLSSRANVPGHSNTLTL